MDGKELQTVPFQEQIKQGKFPCPFCNSLDLKPYEWQTEIGTFGLYVKVTLVCIGCSVKITFEKGNKR